MLQLNRDCAQIEAGPI